MSAKRFFFFATPTEFYSWINTACEKHSLSLVLKGDHRFKEAELESVKNNPRWRFYVGKSEQVYPSHDEKMNPNQWGLVTVDPPKFADDELLRGTISSKSDWTDANHVVHENMTGHEIFGLLRKVMRKHLSNPTWARHIGTPGTETAYRDVWFSRGAAVWNRNGGKLRHRGVANIEYFIEREDLTPR